MEKCRSVVSGVLQGGRDEGILDLWSKKIQICRHINPVYKLGTPVYRASEWISAVQNQILNRFIIRFYNLQIDKTDLRIPPSS